MFSPIQSEKWDCSLNKFRIKLRQKISTQDNKFEGAIENTTFANLLSSQSRSERDEDVGCSAFSLIISRSEYQPSSLTTKTTAVFPEDMRLCPFFCKLVYLPGSSSFAPDVTHSSDILKVFCIFSNLEALNKSLTVNL